MDVSPVFVAARQQTAGFLQVDGSERQKTLHGVRNLQRFVNSLQSLRKTVMGLRIALLLTLIAGSFAAWAAPAPYFLWQGAHRTVCAQTSPGEGWTRISAAYVKSDCSI